MTAPGRPSARFVAGLAWRGGRLIWVGTIAMAVLTGLVPPVAAWVLKELINSLTGAHPAQAQVAMLALVAVLLGALALTMGDLSMVIAASCQRSIAVAVTSDLYAAVNQIKGLAVFEQPGFQDSLRLAEQAAEDTPSGLSSMLALGLQSATTIAGFAGILLATWPPMVALLVAACVPTVTAQLFLARRSAANSEAMMRHYREWFLMRGLLSDPRAVTESRLLGLGEFFRTRLVTALRTATTADYAVKRRIAWTQGGTVLLGSLITAAGAALVAVRAADGRLGVGNFVMFLAAVAGTQGALLATANQWATVGASLKLLRHYVAVLDAPGDLPVRSSLRTPAQTVRQIPPPIRARPLRHGIELRDVWFRYGEDRDWVLRGVHAELPFGQATGLVGVNGAGKSTLIKLLCRLYDPQRGAILWDGADLRELDPDGLRARLAVTFQDFLTYDLTVAENIGLGDLGGFTDRSRITAAASLVNLDAAVQRLPQGYDTIVSRAFTATDGNVGTLLSGGQNQRLALARTLMRADADLLVLDEPSSGLDADAEHRIHHVMQEYRRGRTSLLVSHRLSAVREADQILVLDAGRITERGTHDQLMSTAGSYARLFNRQADGYADRRLAPAISPPN
jgi:ATP-binding cassette, subfamily B, bacterial